MKVISLIWFNTPPRFFYCSDCSGVDGRRCRWISKWAHTDNTECTGQLSYFIQTFVLNDSGNLQDTMW